MIKFNEWLGLRNRQRNLTQNTHRDPEMDLIERTKKAAKKLDQVFKEVLMSSSKIRNLSQISIFRYALDSLFLTREAADLFAEIGITNLKKRVNYVLANHGLKIMKIDPEGALGVEFKLSLIDPPKSEYENDPEIEEIMRRWDLEQAERGN